MKYVTRTNIAITIVIIMLALISAYLDAGKALLPPTKVLTNMSQVKVMNATPYAYTNITNVRLNNEYWYSSQCINYESKVLKDLNTSTNTTSGTTHAFLSDVIIMNGSTLYAYVTIPINISNHTNGEIQYRIYCNSTSTKGIYNHTKS